jgi:hypothetical protein
MSKTMLLDLPYLLSDPDRHGNPRLYVRRHGRRIRIKERPGTSEFLAAYGAAVEALEKPANAAQRQAASVPKKGTMGFLAAISRKAASTRPSPKSPASPAAPASRTACRSL